MNLSYSLLSRRKNMLFYLLFFFFVFLGLSNSLQAQTLPTYDFTTSSSGWSEHGSSSSWNWRSGRGWDNYESAPFKTTENYYRGENSYISSPMLDLRGYTNLQLNVIANIQLYSSSDWAYIEISTDGNTWFQLPSASYHGYCDVNINQSFAINNSYATTPIYIRFRIVDNNSMGSTDDGWLVRNVSVTGTPTAGTISGTVLQSVANAGVSGVSVTAISGSNTYNAVTGADGSYSISALTGNYTLTTSNTYGYTLNPSNPTVTVLGGNTTTQNFTVNGGVVRGTITYTGGTGISGVSVAIGGYTTTTNALGEYSQFVIPGTYTVTPSLSTANYSYSFTPGSNSVMVADDGTATQNFTGYFAAYNLTGNVSGVVAGHLPTVQLFEVGNSTAIASTTTDASGNYSFSGAIAANKQYTVAVASYTGYTFVVVGSGSVNYPSSNKVVNFTAARTNFTITGYVTGIDHTNPNITTLEKVKLSCPGSLENEAYILGNGSQQYTFTVPSFGNYTVTPSMEGFSFTNASNSHTDVTASISAENYSATPNKYTINGIVIGEDGKGLSGVAMNITNQSNITGYSLITTGADGTYSYTVNARQDYTISPSKTGITLKPATATIGNVKGNEVQNFFITTTTLNTYTVTGYVITPGGSGVSGVSITIKKSGETSAWATAVSGTDGKYEFIGVQGQAYVVSGVKTGYSLSPNEITVPSLTGNYAIPTNLVATPIRYNLSGTVNGLKPGFSAMVNLQSQQGSNWVTVTSQLTTGAYTFNTGVEIDSSYRVTASSVGYTLYPSDGRVYSNPSAAITGADFTATINTYTISGTISGVRASHLPVTINCTRVTGTGNVITPVAVTDASGNYSVTVEASSTYRITPVRAGYNFTNSSTDVTIAAAPQPGINFTGTIITHQITGHVTNFSHGSATVTISPAAESGNTTQTLSNPSASYLYSVNEIDNYTITPALTGYTLTPTNASFNRITSNRTQDFIATLNKATISGRVTLNGNNLSGVTITCSGQTNQITGTDGSYSFNVDLFSNYTLTANRIGYSFTTSPITVSNVSSNQTVNFTASVNKYLISGNVYDSDGSTLLANVTVTCNNGNSDRNLVTDGTGSYSFEVSADSNYTITPSMTGRIFNPTNLSITYPIANYTQDFRAEENAVTVSGKVVKSGTSTGVQGVAITVTGNPNSTTTTDANGDYSFTALAGQTYSVTASKDGWSFTNSPLSTGSITGVTTLSNILAVPGTFTISGNVYDIDNSTALSGATVSCDNGTSTRSINTTGTGSYAFIVSADSNYTISCLKTGLVFNPDNRNYQNPTIAYSGQNFKAEQNAVTVTGYVRINGTTTGLKDVLISVSGNPSATTATNSNGMYTFTALAGQSYTINGSKTGWSITPVNLSSGTITEAATVANLTATPLSYTISGTIYNYDNATRLSGVTVSCNNGTNTRSLITTASGTYSFAVRADSNYTITPSSIGMVFNPYNRSYQNPTQIYDTQNFKAEQNAVVVSGYVYKNGTSVGLKDVSIEVAGTPSTTTTTDENGKYSFTALVSQSYSVTGSKIGWVITPTPLNSGTITGNTSLGNLTATPNSYIISGVVYNFDGTTPLQGATVSCTNNDNKTRSLVTGANGIYSFNANPDSSYTITPSLSGYVFNPTNRIYTTPTANYTLQNFKAEQNTYTVTGYVSHNSTGLAGVTIAVSGTPSANTVTDADGKYTFTAYVGNSYSVTASKVGYSITSINGNPQNSGPITQATTLPVFTATTLTSASINGNIYSMGSLLAGATVRLYKNGGLAGTQTTTVPVTHEGYSYNFSGLEADQDYQITVEDAGFTFIPNETGTGTLGVKNFNNLLYAVRQDFATNENTKTISGNIHTSSSNNIANVTVNITSSSFNTSAITGSDGKYTTTVPAGVEYILTPATIPDLGYSFVNDDSTSRATRYTGILAANVTGMDFLAIVKTYNIKINIAGVDQNDVVSFPDIAGSGAVQITGDASGKGTYTYTNVPGLANYTITPNSSEWTFNPSMQSYDNLIGDKEVTFTSSGKQQYKISGSVKRNNGNNLEGIVLTVTSSSATTKTISTTSTGDYSVTVDAGYTYYVNPLTTTGTGIGYTFKVDRPTYTDSLVENIIAPEVINFIATPISGLQISGKIYNGGSLLNGATVTLTYGTTTNTKTTDETGAYLFDGLDAHSNYTIEVHKDGFAFIPNNTVTPGNDGYKIFEDMIVSQIQDFASNTSASIINGDIYTYQSGTNTKIAPVANIPVVITSHNFNTNAITDGTGKFTAQVPVGQEYKITPIDNPDQGYKFVNSDTAANKSRFTGVVISTTVNDMNFRADTNTTYYITGIISGVPAGNVVTVRLYDVTNGSSNLVKTETANSSWVYTFSNVTGLRNYLVVPELNNYAFNPNNRTLKNIIGNKTDQNFTATNALGPQLVSPANNVQGVSLTPTFVWEVPTTGATPTNYKIQVSLSSDFSNAKEFSGNVLTYNGFTLDSYATTYFWRVQSQSTNGNNWSEVWSFTTILTAPELQSPANTSIVSINPTLTWKVVQGATLYDIEIRKQSAGFSGVPTHSGITSTNLSLTGLDNNTTYIWRARARNLAGSTSNWSASWSFTTDASIPSLKSPANGATGQPTDITFEWYLVPGAAKYQLEYSSDPNFPATAATTTLPVDGTSKLVNGFTRNSTYFWRVKVINPVPSSYSEVRFFNVGGSFVWSPDQLNFGSVLVQKSSSKTITFTNNGSMPIVLSNLALTNSIDFTTPNSTETPITIEAGKTKTITVNFTPSSANQKDGILKVYHNVISPSVNPIEIPLSGVGVSTFATLNLPAEIDFGTVIFNSGTRDTVITVYNNSTITGDMLSITPGTFETSTGIFQVIPQSQIILEPGTTYPITIRFNPNALGIQQNTFHLNNTSTNPDVKIRVKANVQQGDLVVTPSYVDFGNTTRAIPYKDTVLAIQNNSAQAITLTGKFITGDTSSYLIDNAAKIVLQPNQTDYVTVRFFPHTAGRKSSIFNITSSYNLAPTQYVTLTGVGGEEPVLFVDMQTIDFGMMRKGEVKDTTVTIRNDGSLDLSISSKEIIGNDKAMFSFVNDGQLIVLRGGESKTLILRASAALPIGGKTAQVKIVSNDPNSSISIINLLATVRSSILFKSAEKIILDTVDIGYPKDTSFVLRNDGDLNAVISKFTFDGAYAQDFKLINVTVPFELAPSESKLINLRYIPTGTGIRYAQILITVNDPTNAEQRIIVQGWGRDVTSNPIIVADGNPITNPHFDFGKVPVNEIKTKAVSIKNLAKYCKLRIDTMYIDSVNRKQPFGYGDLSFPIYINPGESLPLNLSFNPKDKTRSYETSLYIQYTDSTLQPNKNNLLKAGLSGSVIFPGMEFRLTSVLEFGKVIKDQSLTKNFVVTNIGESYLTIDSMIVTGDDAKEFTINDKFPIKLETDFEYTSSVTFKAAKVGSKDAKIIVYSNDVYQLGEIKIWAEGIVSSGQTTGITKTDEIPTTYSLQQNYPNPFNPTTKIEYSIPEASHVTIAIYNSLGQEVAKLVNETQSVGKYVIDWQASNLPSGIYFYKMQSSKFSAFKKMILIK